MWDIEQNIQFNRLADSEKVSYDLLYNISLNQRYYQMQNHKHESKESIFHSDH